MITLGWIVINHGPRTLRLECVSLLSGQTAPQDGLKSSWSLMNIWLFVVEIIDAFILELNILNICDAFVDLGCHTL
jgi:hypothetical protein